MLTAPLPWSPRGCDLGGRWGHSAGRRGVALAVVMVLMGGTGVPGV